MGAFAKHILLFTVGSKPPSKESRGASNSVDHSMISSEAGKTAEVQVGLQWSLKKAKPGPITL